MSLVTCGSWVVVAEGMVLKGRDKFWMTIFIDDGKEVNDEYQKTKLNSSNFGIPAAHFW